MQKLFVVTTMVFTNSFILFHWFKNRIFKKIVANYAKKKKKKKKKKKEEGMSFSSPNLVHGAQIS